MKDILAIGEEEMRLINFKMEDSYSFPVRDGELIPKDPYKAIQSGSAEGVKLLIGTNADEWNYWKQEIPDFKNNFPIRWEALAKSLGSPELKQYMSLRKGKSRLEKSLDLANDIGFRIPSILMTEDQSGHGDTYMYYFKWPSSIEGMGACHAVELAFVFHNVSGPATIYTGPNPPEALADMIQDAWVNFAKTGNPGIKGVAWPKYDKKTRATMFIDKDKWEVVSDPGSEDRKLLEDICRKNIDLH
jgi:para-nitrobenzyl esterase